MEVVSGSVEYSIDIEVLAEWFSEVNCFRSVGESD